MSEEDIIAKVFIATFVIEIIGVLLSLLSISTNTAYFTQFQGFTQSINSTSAGLGSAFSSNALTPLESVTGWFSGVQNAIIWVGNIFIGLINWIVKFALLIYNLFLLLMELIVLLAYVFIVFIPLMFVSTGIVGYVLGFGYAFIFLFLGYKFGKTIITLIGILFGLAMSVIGKVI